MMYSTITLSAMAIVAIVYGGLPAFILPPCA
jgi:hypothetical protein